MLELSLDELFDMTRPRTMDEQLDELLHEGEDMEPIRAFPGYFITSEGRVFSTHGRKARVMKAWSHATSTSVVELNKDGSGYLRSTERLRSEHFDSYMTVPSELYDYILDQYDDEEAIEWAKTVLEDEINRQK